VRLFCRQTKGREKSFTKKFFLSKKSGFKTNSKDRCYERFSDVMNQTFGIKYILLFVLSDERGEWDHK